MAGLTFFLAVVVSLQVAQDGVHSCTLRSHKAAGLQPACSSPGGAADPTSAIPRRTPAAPCATPALGLQLPDALNKIPSISPVSLTPPQPNPGPAAVAPPPVTGPRYLIKPVSAAAPGNDRILFDLLLQYFATLEPQHRLPLPPPVGSSFRGSAPASFPAQLLTPTPYPATPNPQNDQAELQQFLSLLLSVSGPGSDLVNPAVPSDRLLPSLPPAPAAHVTTPPPAVTAVPNATPEAAAATEATAPRVDEPKSTSSVPEVAQEVAPAAPPSSLPAANPADSASAAVQTPDPVSADVPASAPVGAPDSTFVAPEAPGPAPVSNTAPVADSVSASTPEVASSAPLSQPPSDTTTPST